MYDASILVENFWLNLLKKDFLILNQIELGIKIVDHTIIIKHLYENIYEKKPDFRELVKLNGLFYQEVMNFELEALRCINLLKSID